VRHAIGAAGIRRLLLSAHWRLRMAVPRLCSFSSPVPTFLETPSRAANPFPAP
jgi:hypothetical protein